MNAIATRITAEIEPKHERKKNLRESALSPKILSIKFGKIAAQDSISVFVAEFG